MILWPTTYTVESTKNGTITVWRFLNRATVFAGGFEQSGPYVTKLWRGALRRLPKGLLVRQVLVIGLGGGCGLREVERRFPQAAITVIEWDPAMVTIAKELHLYTKEPLLLQGDACDVLPTLEGTFDLVLGDAFYGDAPEARLAQAQHATMLARVLAPGGWFAINISRTLSLVAPLAEHLALEEVWRFRYNTVALYSKRTT